MDRHDRVPPAAAGVGPVEDGPAGGGCLPGSRRPEDSGSIVLQNCGRVVDLLPWDLYSVSTGSVSTRLVPAAGLN